MEHRVPWRRPPDVVDELRRPVRSFPSYQVGGVSRGGIELQRRVGLVGFESWVERDHLVALDFDASGGRDRVAAVLVVLDGGGRQAASSCSGFSWCDGPTVR